LVQCLGLLERKSFLSLCITWLPNKVIVQPALGREGHPAVLAPVLYRYKASNNGAAIRCLRDYGSGSQRSVPDG